MRVLDVEDWLLGIDEGPKLSTLLILHTLFVDLPLHHPQSLGYDRARVLEAYGQVTLVRGVSEERDIVDCVRSGEVEASIVVVAVYIVGVDAIAGFLYGKIQSS